LNHSAKASWCNLQVGTAQSSKHTAPQQNQQVSTDEFERLAYILEEQVQLGVRVGVLSDFKQRLEDVVQQLLKVFYDALLLVHIVQPWQLQCNATD